MKSIFSLLMVLVPLSSVVVGCSNDSDTAGAAGAAGQGGAGDGGAAQGGGAGATAQGGAGAGGTTQGGAGAGGSGEAGAGGSGEAGAGGSGDAVRTGDMCGGVAILGPQMPGVTDECKSCMDTSCCDAGAACGADAECKAMRDCFAGCGADTDCQLKCQSDHPAGAKLNGAFSGCRNTNCGTVCANFACVGKVEHPAPTKDTYTFKVTPKDFQSGMLLPGVKINFCAREDTTCATPLATATSDASGAATLTAKSSADGIDGFLEFTGGGVAPTMLFASKTNPVSIYDNGTLIPLLLSTTTLGLLTSVIGVTVDPERGSLIFTGEDCTGRTTAGISVAASTIDDKSTLAYISGSLPSKTATATDPSGAGTFLNLPPGPVDVTGTLTASGTVFSKQSVVIRQGYLTSTDVGPTP